MAEVAETETATPHPKTCDHPCPITLDSAPLSVPYAKGTGDTGGTGFHHQTVIYISEDRLGLWTTWQRNRGSPERGCFFLCPFLTWTVTCQGSATLKTRGQVPGCREPTAFLHMVKTSTAAALAWRLRLDSRGGGKKTQRANALTLTRTPFTSATMHRDTKVTTSINTSHYEYCFQREAIHGIKTSTGSSSTRTTKLQVVRSGHDCA